jgi:hypothetical protein
MIRMAKSHDPIVDRGGRLATAWRGKKKCCNKDLGLAQLTLGQLFCSISPDAIPFR